MRLAWRIEIGLLLCVLQPLPTEQVLDNFHMPAPGQFWRLHSGKPLRESGLSQDEIRQLLGAVRPYYKIQTALSDDTFKNELLAEHVDMGQGRQVGLVLQDNDRLCQNGNCQTWFFRKVSGDWQSVIFAPPGQVTGIALERFAFVPPPPSSPLLDLVTVSHSADDNYPVHLWAFVDDRWGGHYGIDDYHCWHQKQQKLGLTPCVDFQLPDSMYTSRTGAPLSDPASAGLSEVEIDTIVSTVLKGVADPDMWSADALRRELLVLHLDIGVGADNGLAIQGAGGMLCGGTGNCQIWFFSKSGKTWKLLPLAAGPPAEGALASMFASVPPKHNGLYELVLCTHAGGGLMSIEQWWFDGTRYLSRENYCRDAGSGEVLQGRCQ